MALTLDEAELAGIGDAIELRRRHLVIKSHRDLIVVRAEALTSGWQGRPVKGDATVGGGFGQEVWAER